VREAQVESGFRWGLPIPVEALDNNPKEALGSGRSVIFSTSFKRFWDNALYHKAWDGNQWSPSQTDWDRLGGACRSAPCAVQRGVGLLDIFVLA